MEPRRRTSAVLLSATLAVGLLGACSSDDAADSTSTTSTTPPATSTSAPATTAPATTAAPTTSAPAPVPTTTVASSGPCATGAVPIPAGAARREVVDVDGDDRPDEGWIAQGDDGVVTVGINTAAGGGATTTFDSASPVTRTVLVANADEQGPVELFLDDGRLVQLHAFADCAIAPVRNPEGEDYTFGLGFTDVGTGVGCVDTPDGRRLAGLDLDDEQMGPDGEVAWSRTIVELDGLTAENGTTTTGTYRQPEDDAAVALLTTVTCGDLTVADDGITLPE